MFKKLGYKPELGKSNTSKHTKKKLTIHIIIMTSHMNSSLNYSVKT